MHILVYHVPEMVERLGSIIPFSGQGTIGRVMFAHDCLLIFIDTHIGVEKMMPSAITSQVTNMMLPMEFW